MLIVKCLLYFSAENLQAVKDTYAPT